MKQLDDLEELDDEIDKIIDAEYIHLFKSQIGLSTCQFLKADSNNILSPHSSGVFITKGGVHYVLTASHVISDWSDSSKLFVEIEHGHISIVGKGCGTDLNETKLDVAYIRLSTSIVPLLERWYKFFPVDRLKNKKELITDEVYCVYGFPTKNRVTTVFATVQSVLLWEQVPKDRTTAPGHDRSFDQSLCRSAAAL